MADAIFIPFMGGIFNRMFLGVPYYLWVIVGLVILGLIIGAMFYFLFWWPLTPYHGIFWAHIRKWGASSVFDENMHFDWITERSSKVIFNESFKDAQEAEEDKTESPTATIGRVRVDFIFDPDKWTYPNSYQHKIIEEVAEKYSIIHPEDQIRTLAKFWRRWDEERFDAYAAELKPLKKYYMVSWGRIKMMYRDREESGSFGFIMALAQTIEDIQDNGSNQYWWAVLGFFAAICLAIIGGHYMG